MNKKGVNKATKNTYRKYYKSYYKIDFGSDMVVHHIDFDRDNNDISNLLLIPRTLHSEYHEIVRELKQHNIRIDNIMLNRGVSHASFDISFLENYVSVLNEMLFWIKEKDEMYRGNRKQRKETAWQ